MPGPEPGIPHEWTLLTRGFFDRAPEMVAQEMLGKILAHEIAGKLLAGRIVETEAYLGEDDPAAHAASGRTERNAVLFGPAGHAYIYQIYGLHFCMNVSCLPAGDAGCVLLRALEPLTGVETMRRLRGLHEKASLRELTAGPGRLCQALGITRAGENGADVTSPASQLRMYADDFVCGEIAISPRIGIEKARERPLRFFLREHACVSGGRQAKVVDQPRRAGPDRQGQ